VGAPCQATLRNWRPGIARPALAKEIQMVRRKISVVLAAGVLLALAGCDTQPATNVTSDAATLNAKGGCSGTEAGSNQYQLRERGGSFVDAGPRYSFACNGQGAEVALNSSRIGGLKDDTVYEFRLVSRLNTGQVYTWDSAGTNGGNDFDTFYTPLRPVEETTTFSQFPTTDPETGEVLATAAGNCGRPKEATRNATMKSWTGITIGKTHLMTPWKYCNGLITKMYPADASCQVPAFAGTLGWSCNGPSKIRAYSTGGNPEHAVYTYKYRFERWIPIKGVLVNVQNVEWYSTIQISGSGSCFTHGRNLLLDWPGSLDPNLRDCTNNL
jgi:hypothetical protein